MSLRKQKNSSDQVFKWIGFHYFNSKDSVLSQYLFSKLYLKLPLEKLTKENNNETFHGLSLWAMFWGQKISASHIELYQLIPERKTSGCKIRP